MSNISYLILYMEALHNDSLSLSDENFLASCVKNFKIFFNGNDLAFIKDRNYYYVSATPAYSRMILLSTDDDVDIVGKNDAELVQAKDEERFNLLLAKIRYYDDLTFNKRMPSHHLVIAVGTPEKPIPKTPLINKLKPLINPETDNVVGLLSIIEPVYLLNMPLFILKNCKKYKKHYIPTDNIKLTKIQHIVLFLVCNFLSATEIRIVLDALDYSVSLSRVNGIIQSLKEIFNVLTKDELLEKALRMNFHIAAPEALFPEVFYDIDEFLLTII